MEHLNISFLLLLVFCSSSAKKIFWTHLGTRCVEDCKAKWGEYKCKTIDKDGQSQTMYCSPKANVDYRDRECIGIQRCRKHGYDYYWCDTSWFHWGYCGLITDDRHYGSQTSALCYNHCKQRGQNYYWCSTEQGWDYCSISENKDYKNRQCKVDSPCGKHNHKYNWCEVEGDWGHCGLVEPRMFTHWTYQNDVCIDECQYSESKNYYWCHTDENVNEFDWDYCSPEVNVTYKGQPCHSDHSCGLHGKSYNWCWTSETEYDYCGSIQDAECSYATDTHLRRRTPESNRQAVVICTREDKGNKIITDFTAEPAPDDITDGRQLRHEVDSLIRQWHNGYLVDEARSDLIRSPTVHVDLLSPINRNNQRYYNLQVLLNTPQAILSQVIVPQGVPARYIRRAFLESLRMRARITIEVSTLNHG
ncbi:uncharacterized protein LOC130217672 [Danio aesculapii]|uniref:uncharacterized protein LOC130217672 n=1 Tax=Danio aesculapii TaxID=1142201 RepID=UPI0024C0A8DD|nr:uncharacterized protein LOC130217672 [Danio aesculapii]